MCFVPLLICLIHFLFFRIKGNFNVSKYYFSLFYISNIIIALLPLSDLLPKLHKIFQPIVVTFCILSGIHTIARPLVYDSAMRNHSFQGMTKSFISTTKDMEKYYSLKEWKKVDIPALRQKFLPVIEEAERTNDEGLFIAAMEAYSYYFYDGHVSINSKSSEAWLRASKLLSGNDYGLSMAKLDNGNVVAVFLDENSAAYQNGIRNGTIITSWNGQEINQAIDETEYIYFQTLPVKSTENILKPFMLATKGIHPDGKKGIVADLMQNAKITDDSQRPKALVEFTDEKGNKKELLLDAIGEGIDRFEYASMLLHWKQYVAYPKLKNLETVMINEDTAYMLRNEELSNSFFDVFSYFTNKSPNVRKKLIKELTECKEKGMKNLIIDARKNIGGYWALGIETASLFSEKSFDCAKQGSEIDGKKKFVQTISVEADGRFSDIKVLLLVDLNCVSAGDSLVKVLSECPNVTVMGVFPSNCSCQETGGISFLSNSICSIVYPVNWLYEIDGRRYIDTDETRECTLPLDVKIPLTYDFLVELYHNYQTRDVILDYAINYLKEE